MNGTRILHCLMSWSGNLYARQRIANQFGHAPGWKFANFQRQRRVSREVLLWRLARYEELDRMPQLLLSDSEPGLSC